MELSIDCFSSSTAALLVSALAGSSITTKIHNSESSRLPALRLADGTLLDQPNTICRYVASVSDRAGSLLGTTPIDTAEISQWLSFKNTELQGDPASWASSLSSINSHLLYRTFLACERLTLCDLVLYATLHPYLAAVKESERGRTLGDLWRWFDHIQHLPDVRAAADSTNRLPIVALNLKNAAAQSKAAKDEKKPQEAAVKPVSKEIAAPKQKEAAKDVAAAVDLKKEAVVTKEEKKKDVGPSKAEGKAEKKKEGEKKEGGKEEKKEGETAEKKKKGAEGKEKKGESKKAEETQDAKAEKPAAGPSEEASGKREKKKGGESKEKAAPKAPPAHAAPETSDISKLNIRVGRIIKAWKHPDADSLYVEEIDLGEEKPRTVVSGLVKFIPLEDMQNRMVCCLANLPPAKMRGILSQAMVLAASNEDHTQVALVAPPAGAKIGERVVFEGDEALPWGDPEEQLNPKKKTFEKVAPDLHTDANGVAHYKSLPFMASTGVCISTIPNGSIK